MNMMNNFLYSLGLLNESHSKSVHVAGYISFGSVLVLLLLFILAVIDEFIFAAAFREYLSIVGKFALGGFGLGCVLIVLSTNEII